MDRLEILKTKYGIKQTQNLSFSKGDLTVEFYIDHSFRDLDYIKPAKHLTDEINIIHIYYKNDYTSYFQEVRELWHNDQFKMQQKNEEETIASIENILLKIFLNQDDYKIRAENQWTIKQIKNRNFLCLGALLDTPYDPHKNERVFDPHKRLDKEYFKVYEVYHLYDDYNKKQDWWNVYKENYFFIKYDNHYVSDLYINQFIPLATDRDFCGSESFGVDEILEIKFREDLTKRLRTKYDKNEHYRYFLHQIATEITDTYKKQIRDVFIQLKKNSNHIYQAEQITWNYRKLSPPMDEVVDMLFYFVESGIKFSKELGEKKEPENFSYYLNKSFENAMNIILSNELAVQYFERAKQIIYSAQSTNDWLYSRFNDLYLTSLQKSNFKKKNDFLLSNEKFFLDIVSMRFSFTLLHLEKYETILSWNCIVSNTNIKWSNYIVEKFKDHLFSSENIFEFNCNESLPWSIEFIKRFEDLWNWELLAQNTNVMGNPEIRNHFHNKLFPYIEDYEKSCSKRFNNTNNFGQTLTEEVERNFDFIKKYNELQFQHPDQILNAESIDWRLLSLNNLLPWSAELIGKYIDQWHWSELSRNESVPWDLELIKQFKNRIDWTIDTPSEDGSTIITMRSISSNPNIAWDSELLSAFLDKLDKNDISISQVAKWDIDLLIQFNNFWDLDILSLNAVVWEKVFSEFSKEENLTPLLNLVLEINQNA